MTEILTIANFLVSSIIVMSGVYCLFRNRTFVNYGLRLGCGLATLSAGINCIFISLAFLTGHPVGDIVVYKNVELTEPLGYMAVCIMMVSMTWVYKNEIYKEDGKCAGNSAG